MEKVLGTLEMVLEERRRKKWRFSKATRKAKAETLKCFCSRERKSSSHARRRIEDRNGQIMDICPMNLQEKFQEYPTVNKGRGALLLRQFQIASLISFIKRLPRETSS